LGNAAAKLDDVARIELTADAAADEAATLAMEDASGRLGTEDSLSVGISDMPCSWARARGARRRRRRKGVGLNVGKIIFKLWVGMIWRESEGRGKCCSLRICRCDGSQKEYGIGKGLHTCTLSTYPSSTPFHHSTTRLHDASLPNRARLFAHYRPVIEAPCPKYLP
jgi:hypothetical protein